MREVRRACQADPRLTGALALWGRRLLGEAITQAQYVVADHDDLATLIVTGSGDLSGIAALFRRLQMGHTEPDEVTGTGLTSLTRTTSDRRTPGVSKPSTCP